MTKKRRALISVSNKKNLNTFAKGLSRLGFEIISTGGTADYLKRNGVKVITVEKLTGLPSILGGRVKSLHPAIFGGILAEPTTKKNLKELEKVGGEPFELVVCNLYPFEKTISAKRVKHKDAIENIDIGGPSMVRAAAKNYAYVGIIVDPRDYREILGELKKGRGLSDGVRERLAAKAFAHTARYDVLIASYFGKRVIDKDKKGTMPPAFSLTLEKERDLRYGENPHQAGALYHQMGEESSSEFEQLHGAEISFNNLLDLQAARQIVLSFTDPTVSIVKHYSPCGVAQGKNTLEAFKKALECDPISAFGGIIAMNRRLDKATAEEISQSFFELVVAPSFEGPALKVLKQKKNIRIIQMPFPKDFIPHIDFDFRRISGGFLVQEIDREQITMSNVKVVSRRQPNVGELQDLFFAFNVAKYVRSNAVVLVKDEATVGIGAGQMSRVDSAKIALEKAAGKSIGAVMGSDGFFPFRDSVDEAAKAGITAVIEPGGSKRDGEVIEAANDANIALLFTGIRHFRH